MVHLLSLPEAVVNFEEPLLEPLISKQNLRAVHSQCTQRFHVSLSPTSLLHLPRLYSSLQVVAVSEAASAGIV